jgi:hypothetical protein
MKRLVLLVLIIIGVSFGCTEQQRANKFGGSAKIVLQKDRKLVNVTWKANNSLWVLTRPMKPGESIEQYEFAESSSFGILEGKVFIFEQR